MNSYLTLKTIFLLGIVATLASASFRLFYFVSKRKATTVSREPLLNKMYLYSSRTMIWGVLMVIIGSAGSMLTGDIRFWGGGAGLANYNGVNNDNSVRNNENDEEQIKKVVIDSQMNEVLSIYVNPKTFSEDDLNKYWLPPELGGTGSERIKKSVKRLREKRWRYGDDSKVELFEILSVNISGDEAEVRTSERWFLPLYDYDGNRIMERNPYLSLGRVNYKLRKVNGKWLIQDTTAPYRSS